MNQHLIKTASPSQLEMMSKCEEQWRQRYILGKRIAPSVAAHRGSAVDAGHSHNFRQKVTSHEDLKESDCIDVSVSAFEDSLNKEPPKLSRKEESEGKDNVIGSAKDDVVNIAKGVRSLVAPRHQPITVQKEYRFDIADGVEFIGYADWIGNVVADNTRIIADLKTGKTKPNVDSLIQLTCYAASERRETGVWHPVQIEHVNNVKKKPIKLDTNQSVLELDGAFAVSTVDTAMRDDSDLQPLIRRLNSFVERADAIAKGEQTMPAPSGSWYCSPDWCGYWYDCQFIPSRLK